MESALSIVSDVHIGSFLENTVNLKQEKVKKYREQAWRLRDNLEEYIKEHSEFNLLKMLSSGSLAKGTATSVLNDIDVAVYLKPDAVDSLEVKNVLTEVKNLLIEAYQGKNMSSDQFSIGDHCVKVSFKGSGLDVDVVPIIADPQPNPNDRGKLVTKEQLDWVETSIPLHLQFLRNRKKDYPKLPELIRLTKWWRRHQDLKLKSFMVELLWAHIADTQEIPDSYQEALLVFFKYIWKSQLNEVIAFSDNYDSKGLTVDPAAVITLWDPVNSKNNVAKSYSWLEKDAIVEASNNAYDAITAAQTAHTKGRAIDEWRKIFGQQFDI